MKNFNTFLDVGRLDLIDLTKTDLMASKSLVRITMSLSEGAGSRGVVPVDSLEHESMNV